MKTIPEIAQEMHIPINRIYDEIRVGRIKATRKGKRIYLSERQYKKFKDMYINKKNLTPLRDYLKKHKMSVSQYYRNKYMGKKIKGEVKIGGRIYIREPK